MSNTTVPEAFDATVKGQHTPLDIRRGRAKWSQSHTKPPSSHKQLEPSTTPPHPQNRAPSSSPSRPKPAFSDPHATTPTLLSSQYNFYVLPSFPATISCLPKTQSHHPHRRVMNAFTTPKHKTPPSPHPSGLSTQRAETAAERTNVMGIAKTGTTTARAMHSHPSISSPPSFRSAFRGVVDRQTDRRTDDSQPVDAPLYLPIAPPSPFCSHCQPGLSKTRVPGPRS